MFNVETDREDDGRWIAAVPELPGVLVYAASRDEAIREVEILALRAMADRIEHGESVPEIDRIFTAARADGGPPGHAASSPPCCASAGA